MSTFLVQKSISTQIDKLKKNNTQYTIYSNEELSPSFVSTRTMGSEGALCRYFNYQYIVSRKKKEKKKLKLPID